MVWVWYWPHHLPSADWFVKNMELAPCQLCSKVWKTQCNGPRHLFFDTYFKIPFISKWNTRHQPAHSKPFVNMFIVGFFQLKSGVQEETGRPTSNILSHLLLYTRFTMLLFFTLLMGPGNVQASYILYFTSNNDICFLSRHIIYK